MTANIFLNGLQYLGYILIFPGFLFCFLCGMLLVGIDRKLVARMQKRVGPPILQPFYDFFKLCGNPGGAHRGTGCPRRDPALHPHPRLYGFLRHGGHHRHPLPAADPGACRDPWRCRLRLSLCRHRPEP